MRDAAPGRDKKEERPRLRTGAQPRGSGKWPGDAAELSVAEEDSGVATYLSSFLPLHLA